MDQSVDQSGERIEINPIAHLIAPIAAIGATMLVRKLMSSGYERVTGQPAPLPRDPVPCCLTNPSTRLTQTCARKFVVTCLTSSPLRGSPS